MSEQQRMEPAKAMTVRRGESVVIELPSAPTTGYEWRCVGDPAKLAPLAESFAVESDRVGAGGTQKFVFRATDAGTETLHFEYGRPWKSAAEETHDVVVTVE